MISKWQGASSARLLLIYQAWENKPLKKRIAEVSYEGKETFPGISNNAMFFESRKEKENVADDETYKNEVNPTAPVLGAPAFTKPAVVTVRSFSKAMTKVEVLFSFKCVASGFSKLLSWH